MNLIMANYHLLPYLLTLITEGIILLIALTTTKLFMIINRFGRIWVIFRVTRQIQEKKMTIWTLITFREKSDKPPKENTKISATKKRRSYCPRYHTGKNKGQETSIGIKINKRSHKTIHENVASFDKEEEGTAQGNTQGKIKVRKQVLVSR